MHLNRHVFVMVSVLLILRIHLYYPNMIFYLLKQFRFFTYCNSFGSHLKPLSDCDLVISRDIDCLPLNRMHVALLPIHDMYRLVGPSLTCLSTWVLSIKKNICPLAVDDKVSLINMIFHWTFIKTCFRWLSLWPGVYLWLIFGVFLMFCQSGVEFSARDKPSNSRDITNQSHSLIMVLDKNQNCHRNRKFLFG